MKFEENITPLAAMPEIIEIVSEPVVLDFITVKIKKPISNAAGSVFLPQNYFINPKDGTLYTLKDSELTGFEWNNGGGQVTINDVVQIAANNDELAQYIDWPLYYSFFDALPGQVSFEDLVTPKPTEETPLKVTRANFVTYPTDKLNQFISTFETDIEYPVNMSNRKKHETHYTARVYQRNGTSTESLSLLSDGTITDHGNLITPFMQSVTYALNSIYDQSREELAPAIFTLKSLYEQIYTTGYISKVQDTALEEIATTLAKMENVMLDIDLTPELQRLYKIEEGTQMRYSGALVQFDRIRIKYRGYDEEGYRMTRRPINFEVAKLTNQITTVPLKEIKTPSISRTKSGAVLRDLLYSQIAYMKTGTRTLSNGTPNNRISYDTIYEKLSITPENYKNVKDKRAKTRQQVKKILEDFKNNGTILDFREYQNKKKVGGVEIDVIIVTHNKKK